MKRIYSSKLYIASKRKDKIKAAAENPQNKELIVQLSKYLDEPVDDGEDVVDNTSENNDVQSATNTSNIPAKPAVSEPEDIKSSDNEEEKADDTVESKTQSVTEENKPQDDTIEASTSPLSCHNMISKISEVVDEVAGTLNSREDTKGVTRIMLKEDNKEMWIHYADNVNLNNIMSNVIVLLNACGYYYLEFNRLARSENAIVFQINLANQVVVSDDKEE